MTNANKVKVSKEVAEAIEYLRNECNYVFVDFMGVLSTGKFYRIREAFPLNDVPVERLAEALINGYEVEQTPAEKVAFYYETERLLSRTAPGYERAISIGAMRAVEFVAEAYGLKIEGVNVK